jgi:hypothetical protein
MNDRYKLVGEKGPELNDVCITLVALESMYPPLHYFDVIYDETRPMKVEIEVRKFGLWWKL